MKKFTVTACVLVSIFFSARAQTVNPGGSLALVSPYDEQVVNTLYPVFFWSYNLRGDFRVEYSIRITELMEGQSYVDAMQLNPTLVFAENLMQPSFTYPVNAFPLSEDKKYVWQVEAKKNGIAENISEIWMFQYKTRQKRDTVLPEKKKETRQYVYLNKTLNSAPHFFSDRINFVYNNEVRDTVLNYQLINSMNNESVSRALIPLPVRSGYNYLSIEIPRTLQREAKKKQGVYLLQVSNTRKERWAMKFMIVSKEKK